MVEFRVRYNLGGHIYENRVFAATSGSAIAWVNLAFPSAVDVTVVG